MTNKPMLSVERDLIERAVQAIINTSQMQPALNELRALLDKQSCGACNGCANGCKLDRESPQVEPALESQYAGMTQDQKQAVSDGVDEILHGEPAPLYPICTILKTCNVKSSPASGGRINAVAKPITRCVCHGCAGLPRDVFCPVRDDEQPAPVSDHPQCEECKGWGYHENHYDGGGAECGDCGGSGNASVAVFMPDLDELAQIIRKVSGSHNLGARSLAEAILEEVARLNGLKI